MKIAIADLQPGSGKTTLATQVGLALATRGHSVLLVDATPTNGLEDRMSLSERGTVLDRGGTLILRESNHPKLSVLTGIGRVLADDTLGVHRIEQLSDEAAFTVIDTASEPTILARALQFSDKVFVPIADTESSYASLPAALRLFSEVKCARPSFGLGGFIRCDSRPTKATDAVRETVRRITDEFPELFLTATLPYDNGLRRDGGAMTRPLEAALRVADEITAGSGTRLPQRGWFARWFGRN